MKILNLEKFVNEGYAELHRTVTDMLELDNIDVRCTWDGEHWYYYDKEKRGSLEDFRKLAKNNADFSVRFRYDFSVKAEGSGPDDSAVDECSVEQLVVLHFSDMSANDYDIKCKYCHNMSEFVDIIYDYDTNGDDEPLIKVRELVSGDLNSTEDEIAENLEDYTGISVNESYDIVASIIGEAINGFMKSFEE